MNVGIKQMVAALGLVFAVTLAIIVGKQMTTEAMAVVIGVVCGVLAGIPTSVLLLVALSRRDSLRAREETAARQAPANYPPVVVIQGGGTGQPALNSGYWPAPNAAPLVSRQFHVVGGDELLVDDNRYQ
jgi:anti-sigma factor RsiW